MMMMMMMMMMIMVEWNCSLVHEVVSDNRFRRWWALRERWWWYRRKNREGGWWMDEVGENELVDVGVVGVVESFVGSKRGKGQVSRAARDDRNCFFTLPGGWGE